MTHENHDCPEGECYYCFIHQADAHKTNLDTLSSVQLSINVAEYVGPETAIAKNGKPRKLKLEEIPIRLCIASHLE